MCGRIAQYRAPRDFTHTLDLHLKLSAAPIGRYNVAPTTGVHVLHEVEGQVQDSVIPWGWKPHWAKGRAGPINARLETVATKPFFRPIWKSGRCIVGADGWYEWKKDPADPKRKQPYFIRLASGEPLLFAAIGQLPGADEEPGEGAGFVIITGAADAGLVDVHDRKPLVLSPDFARSWLAGSTTPADALHIAEHQELPAEAFEWYPVSREVGNVRNKGAHLIERIADPIM